MSSEGEGDGQSRADAYGFMLIEADGLMTLDEPMFGTPVTSKIDSFDFYGDEPVQIIMVQVPADQLPKELMFLPALLLLALIAMLQRGRARKEEGVPA